MPRLSHHCRSDADKLADGTFDKRYSEAARAERAAQKIMSFPTHREIPEPSVPLNEVGLAEYNKLCRIVLDAGRLTEFTRLAAESAATAHQQIHKLMAEGRDVPTSLIQTKVKAIQQLQLAEAAAPIGNQGANQSKFRHAGFSNRKPAR